MVKLNVYTSLITSVIVQVITGIIELASLFINVPSKFSFLKQMMLLELFVQLIEGTFYLYWLYNFKSITNITPKRYFDWVITTPTMLINLIFYLIFLKHRDDNTSNKLNFFTLFKKEFSTIIIVLLLNWLMLLFGYLTEISVISVIWGVSLGFIPFLIYYYIIYKKYALLSNEGLTIYFYFFTFWSLYGVAAFLPYKIKNMFYNILDLFAKNFFGLFLTYLLFTSRTKSSITA
jgi:bacteriorhodopsin